MRITIGLNVNGKIESKDFDLLSSDMVIPDLEMFQTDYVLVRKKYDTGNYEADLYNIINELSNKGWILNSIGHTLF